MHIFRHSATTWNVKEGMPPMLINKQRGWSKDSKMLARYSHIENEDVDDYYREKLGIQSEEEKQEGKVCPRCRQVNPPFVKDQKICAWCGCPFDAYTAIEMEKSLDYQKAGTHLLDKLLERKPIQRLLKEIARKEGIAVSLIKSL